MNGTGLGARRVGEAMVAFGAVGLALAIVAAGALLATTISVASLSGGVGRARADIATSLHGAGTTLGHAADATAGAGASLASSERLLGDSSATLGGLADASDALAGGLGAVSILGGQPFAGAASQFRTLSGRLRVFADDASGIAGQVGQDGAELTTVAADLRGLQASVRQASDELDSLDPEPAATSLLWALVLWLAMTAWLGAGALGCAWAGWRLRRREIARSGPRV